MPYDAPMHAALVTGRHQVEFREFPDPVPAADGVVVDIALCGICGTDVHAYTSGRPYRPSICGHEWAGTLSAVGDEVHGLTEGDRVVVAVPPACGRCEPCRAGHAERCDVVFLAMLGREADAPPHGGFAPRIAVGAGRVHPADPGLSDEQAAQVEPATVAFHAVRRTPPRLGDTTVVQGAGPIGLLTLQWARAAGAGRVIVVEPDPSRADLADRLGADHTVAPGEPATALVTELTSGLGADVVYECVGRPDTVQAGVDLARRGGQLSLIGLATEDVALSPSAWLTKELAVVGALAYTHDDFDKSMGMIADGRVDVDALHTRTVPLDKVETTIAALADGSSRDTKVLVDPR